MRQPLRSRRSPRRRHRAAGPEAARLPTMPGRLPPVPGAAQAFLELGHRAVKRGEPVVRGGLGADGGPAGQDGQLDALPAARLPRIAFSRDFHVHPDRLVRQLRDLVELRQCIAAEPLLHIGAATLEDDVHNWKPPSSRVRSPRSGHPPGRPGLRPHIRLPRGSRPAATTTLLPAREISDPPAGQDLPLSRTVIGRREVALRGPFRLRLASACRDGPAAPGGWPSPAQPRTRAGAIPRS